MTSRCTSRRILPRPTPEAEMGRIYAPGEAPHIGPSRLERVELRCNDDAGHHGPHVGFANGRRIEWS